jgi:hypothetical protein
MSSIAARRIDDHDTRMQRLDAELKRSGWSVDRRALPAQAVHAFVSFEAEPGLIFKVYSQPFEKALTI